MSSRAAPIIDLFAGPGGLAEGFSNFRRRGNPAFRVELSIEKDRFAHGTLQLRSFFRQFDSRIPDEYWAYLRGSISKESIFARFPAETARAVKEARRHELGIETDDQTRVLVREALRGYDGPWGLIGGPPCQAYSLVGRSRNMGKADYVPENDRRQTLYLEYLQIIADHEPTFFVMENVKGLLSATLSSERVFERIVEDLRDPARALKRENRRVPRGRPKYTLYPLAVQPVSGLFPRARDFIVRSEEHGIPQARHRVILLGVMEGVNTTGLKQLKRRTSMTVTEAISDLPRLRSGLTDRDDSDESWCAHITSIPARRWFAELESSELRRTIISELKRVGVHADGRGAEIIQAFNRGSSHVPYTLNHAARAHIADDLDRYFFLSCFGKVFRRSPVLADFPDLLLPDHKNVRSASRRNHFSDRFRVQLGDRPSTTITSHISKDGHYYVHPDPSQCRSFTVREAARLQTFADNYFFCGPRTEQYQQVGNAVPPALAEQIAEIVSVLV